MYCVAADGSGTAERLTSSKWGHTCSRSKDGTRCLTSFPICRRHGVTEPARSVDVFINKGKSRKFRRQAIGWV